MTDQLLSTLEFNLPANQTQTYIDANQESQDSQATDNSNSDEEFDWM